MFRVYLKLGFEHISDLQGYDHILFIVALCVVFAITDWRKILILVTAFTIGHSITLALSTLQMIRVPADLIEFLIPVTILITALQNLWYKPNPKKMWSPNYYLALFFGFIHGMGFANYFKALLGREADIVLPLFAFNVGVELGQLCIVACLMLLNLLATQVFKIHQKYWTMVLSLGVAGMACYLIFQKMAL